MHRFGRFLVCVGCCVVEVVALNGRRLEVGSCLWEQMLWFAADESKIF